MAAPKIRSIPSSATFTSWQQYNTYRTPPHVLVPNAITATEAVGWTWDKINPTTTPTATQLSQFKVYDTFRSTKSVTHFTARKVYDHFHSAKPARFWAAICVYVCSPSLP
ncbi:hypothetical protein AVEN_42603-1 [Araneus ventricosus]|uniref:Uncharacterized protein n=1 Tax=Araneus ventricosus TaxID=182803 RepID=A0A4Y2JUN1_ARAVE|nr:hypothetical protein AVEN_42603-1 [Araneus ventricosus]